MKKWIVVFLLQTSILYGAGSITIEQGTGSITMEQGTDSISMTREYDPPMNLVYTNSSSSTLTAAWDYSPAPPVSNYTVRVSSSSNMTGTITSSTTISNSALLGETPLLASTTYYGQVRTNYQDGNSSPYSVIVITATRAAMELVQSTCSVPGFNDPGTLTFSNSVVVGNTIVVLAVTTGENLNTNSATDNKGNTYAQRSISAGAASESAIFVATSVATGGSSFAVTVDANGTGGAINFCAAEFTGVTLYDQQNTATGTSASADSGNITTTGAAIWLGVMTHETGSPTITPDSPWITIGEYEPNTFQSYSAIYKISTTGETDSASWSLGASPPWRANAVTLD